MKLEGLGGVFGVFSFVAEKWECGFLWVLAISRECSGFTEEGCECSDAFRRAKDSG